MQDENKKINKPSLFKFLTYRYHHEIANGFKNGSKVILLMNFISLGSSSLGNLKQANLNYSYAFLGGGACYVFLYGAIDLYYSSKLRKKFDSLQAQYNQNEDEFLEEYRAYEIKLENQKKRWKNFLEYTYQIASLVDFICLICDWTKKINIFETIHKASHPVIFIAIVAVSLLCLSGSFFISKDIAKNNKKNIWDPSLKVYRSIKNGRHFVDFCSELVFKSYLLAPLGMFAIIPALLLVGIDRVFDNSIKRLKTGKSKNILLDKFKAYGLGSVSGATHSLYLYQFYWITANILAHSALTFGTGGIYGVVAATACAMWGLYGIYRNFRKTNNAVKTGEKSKEHNATQATKSLLDIKQNKSALILQTCFRRYSCSKKFKNHKKIQEQKISTVRNFSSVFVNKVFDKAFDKLYDNYESAK